MLNLLKKRLFRGALSVLSCKACFDIPHKEMRMQRPVKPLFLATALLLCAGAQAQESLPRTPAPEGAHVYFIEPQNGAHVAQTFTVKFGLSGMGVAPAGVDFPKTGHHHLLIDNYSLPEAQPIPFSDHSLHFGGGQTETQITLKPGKHSLQLLLGDKNHIPFDPPIISERIEVTVE